MGKWPYKVPRIVCINNNNNNNNNNNSNNSTSTTTTTDRPVGLVVKAVRAEDPGTESRLRHGDFSGSSYTSDFKIGTPVATLPVA